MISGVNAHTLASDKRTINRDAIVNSAGKVCTSFKEEGCSRYKEMRAIPNT